MTFLCDDILLVLGHMFILCPFSGNMFILGNMII